MGICWPLAGLLLPFVIYGLAPAAIPLFGLAGLFILPTCRKNPGVLVLLIACAWTCWHIDRQSTSWGRFEEPRIMQVEGRVSSLPVVHGDHLEFALAVAPRDSSEEEFRLIVRWYRDWPELRAGETWRLNLNVKPARSRVNFSGQGREPWFFSNRIAAVASVVDGANYRIAEAGPVDSLARRQRLSQHVAHILDGHPAFPVIVTLAVADRRFLDHSDRHRFQVTGTSHLLAISGLHVGIAAAMGWWLGRLIMLLAPAWFALRYFALFCWLASAVTALAYASMSGFPPSTQRALIMLGCAAVSSLAGRTRRPWRVLGIALALVLIADPLAPLGAGLWLSFGTVAALVWAFSFSRVTAWWRIILRAQWAIMLISLPLGMLIFQRTSPGAFAANLLAIPWASALVVPPTVAATLLLPVAREVSAFALYVSAENMRWLGFVLEYLANVRLFQLKITPTPVFASVLLAITGAAITLLPQGLTRRMVAGLLIAPLLIRPSFAPDSSRIEMLDVGQGLSVMVRSGARLLLYDSGPGDGRNWSLVPGVIAPAIASSGRVPEQVIISHGDLDHAGGLHELQQIYPDVMFLGSMPAQVPGVNPCMAGDETRWSIARLRMLHPSEGLPYLGNDNSCVLSIETSGRRILLAGDISRNIEQRLVLEGLQNHDVLLVAHHGSNSSSSPEFLATVQASHALNSAAKFNRYGFPHPAVEKRLAEAGAQMISTSECGAARLDIGSNGKMRITTARVERGAPWRWPAAANCP